MGDSSCAFSDAFALSYELLNEFRKTIALVDEPLSHYDFRNADEPGSTNCTLDRVK